MFNFQSLLGVDFSLSNRETAIALWAVMLGAWSLRSEGVRSASISVIRAATKPKVLIILAAYGIFLSVVVWFSAKFGVWRSSLMKDTLIWTILAGLPLVMTFPKVSSSEKFVQAFLRDLFAVSILLEFLVNKHDFPLQVEVFLVPFIALSVTAATLYNRKKLPSSQLKFWNGLLALIAVAMISFSLFEVWSEISGPDALQLLLQFLLPIWLSVASLMFVLALALFAAYESAFLRMAYNPFGNSVSRKAKAVFIVALGIRLNEVHRFRGSAMNCLATSSSIYGAWLCIQKFRRTVEDENRERESQKQRLLLIAGLQGEDTHGRQLDRREFIETQKALRWVATCQWGWYKSLGGRYRPDLIEVLRDFSRFGLPADHGISLRVSADGQAWYAYRQTISGWVLAIGSSKPPPSEWLYDGVQPPTGFPGTDLSWGTSPFGIQAPNW